MVVRVRRLPELAAGVALPVVSREVVGGGVEVVVLDVNHLAENPKRSSSVSSQYDEGRGRACPVASSDTFARVDGSTKGASHR